MNNTKLFAKNEKKLKILLQAIEICSQRIEIEFDFEKCAMLTMKSREK